MLRAVLLIVAIASCVLANDPQVCSDPYPNPQFYCNGETNQWTVDGDFTVPENTEVLFESDSFIGGNLLVPPSSSVVFNKPSQLVVGNTVSILGTLATDISFDELMLLKEEDVSSFPLLQAASVDVSQATLQLNARYRCSSATIELSTINIPDNVYPNSLVVDITYTFSDGTCSWVSISIVWLAFVTLIIGSFIWYFCVKEKADPLDDTIIPPHPFSDFEERTKYGSM